MRALIGLLAIFSSTLAAAGDATPPAALAGLDGVAVQVSLPSIVAVQQGSADAWQKRVEALLGSQTVRAVNPAGAGAASNQPVLHIEIRVDPSLPETAVLVDISLVRSVTIPGQPGTVRATAWRRHELGRVKTATAGDFAWTRATTMLEGFAADVVAARPPAIPAPPAPPTQAITPPTAEPTRRATSAPSSPVSVRKDAAARGAPEDDFLKYKGVPLDSCFGFDGDTACCAHVGESCSYTVCQDTIDSEWTERTASCK
ncbi:hypothetical protein QEG98_28270 [Myxococcus sp. MxC21-1]|uniref:hypothetical protein n=1 Tax=Myxococcus sp. MxC21-1 TaxID=3041439 RepID=UPI0029302916|nr:hypothetical protein [Myxococcus sp. MxC21-1]WNZ59902.1 hypothetical protein QEG98_28270 [Myxococcus sp. MxC21-1]